MSPFNIAEYEPVEDRLRAYWQDWPDGRIATELKESAPGSYIVMAEVYRVAKDIFPAATGLAQEDVTERGVNATSALENCETSAIGRALANMGYAAKGKRPSREEMSKASRGAEGFQGKGSEAPRGNDSPVVKGDGEAPAATGETTSAGGRATVSSSAAEVQPPADGKRKYPMAANKCLHAYPATEDARCSGCGMPLDKIEAKP